MFFRRYLQIYLSVCEKKSIFAHKIKIVQMKNLKSLPCLITLLTGIAVCLFFGIAYPYHITYHEQFLLFLYDADYIHSVLCLPGGGADLLGRFVSQWFLYPWAGAVIVALLLMSVQALAARKLCSSVFYGMTLLAPASLVLYVGNIDGLMGGVMALLLALLAAAMMAWFPLALRRVVAPCLLPVLYWVVGPMAVVTVFSMAERWWMRLLLLVELLVLPLLAHQIVALSMQQLFVSPHYFRTPEEVPYLLWLAALMSVVPQLLREIELLWQKRKQQTVKSAMPDMPIRKRLQMAFVVVMALMGGTFVVQGMNPQVEQAQAYYYQARFQRWDRLLQMAQQQEPNSALTSTLHNLALGMKGRLPEKMFTRRQNGIAGLIPPFANDTFSPLCTAEVYYHLGMIHTAQRFIFEAQEAMPDYQKSAACYKRLAETNLICGYYDVSLKYLKALQKTLFYSKWATKTLALLDNEMAIISHREYGALRSSLNKEEYYFSDQELPMMLGKLLLSNRQNRLAFEYLEACYLLTGNLDMFANCFTFAEDLHYPMIPTHFQEGLIMWWSKTHTPNDPLPVGFTPALVQRFDNFVSLVRRQVSDDQIEKQFGHTYWYYQIHNQ